MAVNIAILDLNEGQPNLGMKSIREIIHNWEKTIDIEVSTREFEVRQKIELPDLSFDIYISSGGPGSPLDSEGTEWENKFFEWIRSVETWNQKSSNYPKKHVLFICHSFQLACRYYNVATICKRNSTSFGVFPVHLLAAGKKEPVFEALQDPFYAMDSRDFQAISPKQNRLKAIGAKILAIEKERPHVPLERAIMAIRFNPYFIGSQFHPEANAEGMSMYLQRADKKKTVIENYGEAKWKNMVAQLQDPDKIMFTYNHIVPNFLQIAAGQLAEVS